MKSSLSNPSADPSASSPRHYCYEIDPKVAALNVVADTGTSHLLSYAQFLDTDRNANPELEQRPDAPPERMRIHFARADVVILGSGLRRLEAGIQKQELKSVRSKGRAPDAMPDVQVEVVTITFNKEQPYDY